MPNAEVLKMVVEILLIVEHVNLDLNALQVNVSAIQKLVMI